jgi:hypothetical protein
MTGYFGRLAARVAGPSRPAGAAMAAPAVRAPAGTGMTAATDPFVASRAAVDAAEQPMPHARPPAERPRSVAPSDQMPRADSSVVSPNEMRPATQRVTSAPAPVEAPARDEREPAEIPSPRPPRRRRPVLSDLDLSAGDAEPDVAGTQPRASADLARPAISARSDVPDLGTTSARRGPEIVEPSDVRPRPAAQAAVVQHGDPPLRPADEPVPPQPRAEPVPLIARPNGGEARRPAQAVAPGRGRPPREVERRPKVELSIGSITVEVQPAAAVSSPPPRERPARRPGDPAGGFESARRLSRLYLRGV